MGIFRPIIASIVVLILIAGCTQQNTDLDEFFVFANHENMNDELRESLFKCLNKEDIEYQVDKDKNVLIKRKDSDHAVSRCS